VDIANEAPIPPGKEQLIISIVFSTGVPSPQIEQTGRTTHLD
jgi:hypothetical protein